jgi:hypothetical protein
MKSKIFFAIYIFLAIALGISGTMFYQTLNLNKDNVNIEENKNIEDLEQIANECNNLELEETAKCLRDEIKIIYNYKSLSERNKTFNENRTFEDIKENGGNCYDYTYLYMQLGDMLGFDNSYISQTGIEDVKSPHRYFIMWNETNYCTIDQTSYKCEEIK